jgi:hypothetical protein
MKGILGTALFVSSLLISSTSVFAQSESRDQLLKSIEAKRAELEVLEQQILEPSEQDKIAYAEFLKQPHTGLIRLLPREKYDHQGYKDGTPPSVTIRGGGAFYSFTNLSHDYNAGAELSLEMGKLGVGFAGADYGMLTSLGDLPLEDVTIDQPNTRFILEYSVPSAEPVARSEARRFGVGSTIGGALYANRIPAKVDTTYLLRSISFVASDVLVALRITRQDTDGSVIIVWKLLKKYPTPRLARNG